jgi:hypothetical protein
VIYRVRRQSIEPEGAARRVLLEAVEIEERDGTAVLRVAGEPLLIMRTLDELLAAMELELDDLEVRVTDASLSK